MAEPNQQFKVGDKPDGGVFLCQNCIAKGKAEGGPFKPGAFSNRGPDQADNPLPVCSVCSAGQGTKWICLLGKWEIRHDGELPPLETPGDDPAVGDAFEFGE